MLCLHHFYSLQQLSNPHMQNKNAVRKTSSVTTMSSSPMIRINSPSFMKLHKMKAIPLAVTLDPPPTSIHSLQYSLFNFNRQSFTCHIEASHETYRKTDFLRQCHQQRERERESPVKEKIKC